jgi:hypothetical protein
MFFISKFGLGGGGLQSGKSRPPLFWVRACLHRKATIYTRPGIRNPSATHPRFKWPRLNPLGHRSGFMVALRDLTYSHSTVAEDGLPGRHFVSWVARHSVSFKISWNPEHRCRLTYSISCPRILHEMQRRCKTSIAAYFKVLSQI